MPERVCYQVMLLPPCWFWAAYPGERGPGTGLPEVLLTLIALYCGGKANMRHLRTQESCVR